MARRLEVAAVVLAAVLLVATPAIRTPLLHALTLLATGQFTQFQLYLQTLGAWAPVVSIGLMLAAALAVPVPVTIIMVANGLVFGVWRGMLVSFAGSLLGALLAYAIGRRLGRALIARVLPAASLAAADRLMARYGRWAIVLERWIPGVPGDPMSYLAGLTHMPVAVFLGLTAIGLVPAIGVTAYVGAEVATDVPLAYWIGGLVTIAVVWIGWRKLRARSTSAS